MENVYKTTILPSGAIIKEVDNPKNESIIVQPVDKDKVEMTELIITLSEQIITLGGI
ncbi:MAG: hypothetical protein ACREV6_12805 [Clostridium sp.]|uniref:hypothetical protein n=1 Tax=Clostridium sp. TaxID=1506 RepID=UPI003D6D827B